MWTQSTQYFLYKDQDHRQMAMKPWVVASIVVLLSIVVCLTVYYVFLSQYYSKSKVNGGSDITQSPDGPLNEPTGQSPSSVLYAHCTAKLTNTQAIKICRDAIRQNPAFRGRDVFVTGYTPVPIKGLSANSGVLRVSFLQWDAKDTPASFTNTGPETWKLQDVPKSAAGPTTLLISYHDQACGDYMVDALAAAGSADQDWCMDYRTRVLATCNQKEAPTVLTPSAPPQPTTPLVTTPAQPPKSSTPPMQPCPDFWKAPN
jgi:hypothetical protein